MVDYFVRITILFLQIENERKFQLGINYSELNGCKCIVKSINVYLLISISSIFLRT